MIRTVRCIAAACWLLSLVFASLVVSPLGARAATKTTKATKAKVRAKASTVAPDKPCSTLNAHGPRSTYDCVRTPTGLLWQNRGSMYNPFAIREPGSTGQPNPVRSYSVGVIDPIVAIDPTVIGSPSAAKPPIPAGEVPTLLKIGVTNWSGYMGDLGELGVVFDLVDAAGAAYSLKGEHSCEMYGDVSALAQLPFRRLKIMESIGVLCAVIPAAALGESLRLRIGSDWANGKGMIYEYWRVS